MLEHELDQYWKTVVDTIQDGVMIVDIKGIIVSANRALEQITGYLSKELIGKPCSVLNCSSCDAVFERKGCHWCSLFKSGSLKMRKCTLIKKDGNIVNIIKNASVLNNTNGEVIGAVETVTDITELMEKENKIEAFRRELESGDTFHGMVGISAYMRRAFDLITNVAVSDAPALILGESGTGKELVARAVHLNSERKNGPYIKVNCAALNESVLESELFGHVKGAFTGAYQGRVGRFEAAAGGTIFLDEIGDLPLSIQVKLLRVLEEKIIERVGDNKAIPVDVRIVTATNRNLKQLVESGSFRSDFYYRINVLPINLPPLRDRVEDIPLISEMFFRRIQLKSNKSVNAISPEAMQALLHYSWPGNVRELKSAFEYAFVTCTSSRLEVEHFPPDIVYPSPSQPLSHAQTLNMDKRNLALSKSLSDLSLDERKKNELIQALAQAKGNRSLAAKILGISRVTVWNRINRYGIKFEFQEKEN
ncbi:MAG: sigma 54-interacting transcriptional regulator [Desulfamplus sp.]|nr:sigma 54-interacting transcriptional regulator [Desulfamplus sp.]